MTPLPPLVRDDGVVHGELIITLKRTRDLAQKKRSRGASHITTRETRFAPQRCLRRLSESQTTVHLEGKKLTLAAPDAMLLDCRNSPVMWMCPLRTNSMSACKSGL